jgi:hypothetical protein
VRARASSSASVDPLQTFKPAGASRRVFYFGNHKGLDLGRGFVFVQIFVWFVYFAVKFSAK